MRSLGVTFLIVSMVLSLQRFAAARERALGSEEIEIYRGFLKALKDGGNQIFLVDGFGKSPLEQINGELGPYVAGRCLVDIDFGLASNTDVSYVMPRAIVQGTGISIVKRSQVKAIERKLMAHHSAAEIISLSTICFDRTHQFAVFQWSHSGSWQLIVVELRNGRWTRSHNRNCAETVE